MVTKGIPEDFKVGIIATLRYLVEDLCFYSDTTKEKQFDTQGMKIQWDRVIVIYQAAYKLTKKEIYRE